VEVDRRVKDERARVQDHTTLVTRIVTKNKMESTNSLGKTGTGGRSASENLEYLEAESRPKRRREDRGKGRMAVAGEDPRQSQEDSEGRYLELQSMVVSQGQKLDMLLDLWTKQSGKEREEEKGMERKAPEDGTLGTR